MSSEQLKLRLTELLSQTMTSIVAVADTVSFCNERCVCLTMMEEVPLVWS